jgi:hypothetical protein
MTPGQIEQEELRKKHGTLFDEISALLFRHDPMEINYESNCDEYDSEVGTILPRLPDCQSEADVLAVVDEEFRRWFDDAGPIKNYAKIAGETWALWRERTFHPMPDTPPEKELLLAAYVAFNARDIDAALALMTDDVAWPRAFKGGFVCGPEEVRAYWTEQWSEIDPTVEPVSFHTEDSESILVVVDQVVRDLADGLLASGRVLHRFTLKDGLIQRMEVVEAPSANPPA